MRAGLFIGVAKYNDTVINALSYPCKDARRLLEQLTRTSGFSSKDSVVCISDELELLKRPSKENILEHLASFEKGAELEAFVFFFSGHGFHAHSGIDYLVPQNATMVALPDTSLALADIVRRSCRVNARNIIIIIDACRENFAFSATFEPIVPSISGQAFTNKNVSMFFSADSETISYESDVLEAGVYTHSFCEALEIEHDCKKMHELQAYLLQEVPAVSERVGKPIQKPWAAFLPEQARDFILPVSKLYEKLNLPQYVGREIGRPHAIRYEGNYPWPIVIDFGTSKSVLAYRTSEGYDFARDSRGRVCVPSTVKFFDDGNYEVGTDPFGGVDSRYSKRRILDQLFDNTQDALGMKEDHYAMLVIDSLVRNFEKQVKKKARRCVLSIPTDYNILDVSRIVDCVQASGVRVERVIPEPTAAAFNILSTLNDKERDREDWVVVVDMGGGTLDIAFIYVEFQKDQFELEPSHVFNDALIEYLTSTEVEEDENEFMKDEALSVNLSSPKVTFTVLASSGDARLGGIDFNSRLKAELVSRLQAMAVSGAKIVDYSEHELESEIERAKIALSGERKASIHLQDVMFSDESSKPVTLHITRSEFNTMSLDLFNRYRKCIEDCISFGQYYDDIDPNDEAYSDENDEAYSDEDEPGRKRLEDYRSRVSVVIVAGQSGQVYEFKEYLRKYFPRARLIDDYADRAVARGLAGWLYSGLDLEVRDIAHTYISVAGVDRRENALVITGGCGCHTLIYPTDKIPHYVDVNIYWYAAQKNEITITTNTIGKSPVPVCAIQIEAGEFVGNFGFMRVSVDKMLTVVVEISDFKNNRRCWQINNFFRIPFGYAPVGNIDNASAGLRLLKRAPDQR